MDFDARKSRPETMRKSEKDRLEANRRQIRFRISGLAVEHESDHEGEPEKKAG
jgi:hypothetical protein